MRIEYKTVTTCAHWLNPTLVTNTPYNNDEKSDCVHYKVIETQHCITRDLLTGQLKRLNLKGVHCFGIIVTKNKPKER